MQLIGVGRVKLDVVRKAAFLAVPCDEALEIRRRTVLNPMGLRSSSGIRRGGVP